jgi:hypothetical protein
MAAVFVVLGILSSVAASLVVMGVGLVVLYALVHAHV